MSTQKQNQPYIYVVYQVSYDPNEHNPNGVAFQPNVGTYRTEQAAQKTIFSIVRQFKQAYGDDNVSTMFNSQQSDEMRLNVSADLTSPTTGRVTRSILLLFRCPLYSDHIVTDTGYGTDI